MTAYLPGHILASTSFGGSMTSDMDDLGFSIISGVYHRLKMTDTVSVTSTSDFLLYEYELPSSFAGDCALYFEATVVGLTTAGTNAGSSYGYCHVCCMNRDGGTWRGPNNGGGTTEIARNNAGGGVSNLSLTTTRSGNKLQLKVAGLASQTIAVKALINVVITS